MLDLNDDNFLITAAKHYDNVHCTGTEEFLDDVRRLKYIKKLLTRYQLTGELKDRLILNHLVILKNVFGPQFLARIIFLKMPKQLKYIKPFMDMLGILPKTVKGINGKSYETSEIEDEVAIIEALRKI